MTVTVEEKHTLALALHWIMLSIGGIGLCDYHEARSQQVLEEKKGRREKRFATPSQPLYFEVYQGLYHASPGRPILAHGSCKVSFLLRNGKYIPDLLLPSRSSSLWHRP